MIFAERLEFGGGRAIGKTLTLAATAQYGKALSPLFFLPLDPCSPPILPLEELDAQEPINFLPPLAIQRDALTWQANQQLFTLGKCDDEGGGGTQWLYKVT